MERDYIYQRGCICWYDDPVYREEGSFVLHGKRPVVIVSDDSTNETSATVIVVPLTTSVDKRLYPGQFDIFLKGVTSRVRCDQIRVVDKSSLSEPYATMNDECMDALDKATMVSLGMKGYLPEEEAVEEEYESVARLVKSY